jgi:hypothetical protein
MLAEDDPEKNFKAPLSNLYSPEKKTSGFHSKILINPNDKKEKVKISKEKLY